MGRNILSRGKELIKNTAIVAVGKVCTKFLSFFLLPFYTAVLSTEEYGTVDMVTTYSGILVILLTLQFEQGVFRYLIESRSNEEKQKDKKSDTGNFHRTDSGYCFRTFDAGTF